MERRHSSSRDAFLNNMHEFGVGKALGLGILGDVGSALSAAAVQPVTAGASGRENVLALGFRGVELRLRVGGLLCRRLPDQSKADTNRNQKEQKSSLANVDCPLEKELRPNLHNAWVTRGADDSELGGVDLARRIQELSVVEEVECFKAQLKLFGFGDLGRFQQRHVPVIEA